MTFVRRVGRVTFSALAIPNYRLTPTGKSVFQFWETPVGQPRAMRAWFYPGDNFGQEFAYYKTKSIEIAKVTNAPVPAVVMESEAELKTAPVVVVDAAGTEKPIEVLIARNNTAQADTMPAHDAPAPSKLPDTGSEYPLIGLVGFGSIIASRLLSRFSKRA